MVADPHAWQDLANGVVYVSNIVDALSAADPANAGRYRAAGDRYIETLRALDGDVRRRIEKVAPAKRRVITSHDAFGYFGGAYGVEFLAPEGISTEAEPSASDLAKLIDQIKREHIKTLFVENIADPRMIDMIARETGSEVGGPLFLRCAVAGRWPSAALCRHVQEQRPEARRCHAQELGSGPFWGIAVPSFSLLPRERGEGKRASCAPPISRCRGAKGKERAAPLLLPSPRS